jgi:hypothetical protein
MKTNESEFNYLLKIALVVVFIIAVVNILGPDYFYTYYLQQPSTEQLLPTMVEIGMAALVLLIALTVFSVRGLLNPTLRRILLDALARIYVLSGFVLIFVLWVVRFTADRLELYLRFPFRILPLQLGLGTLAGIVSVVVGIFLHRKAAEADLDLGRARFRARKVKL